MSRRITAVLATAGLAACGGGSTSTSQPSASTAPVAMAPAAPAAPAQPMQVDFTTFTKSLVATRSDSTSPVEVSTTEFAFPDNDNAAAFASVLASP